MRAVELRVCATVVLAIGSLVAASSWQLYQLNPQVPVSLWKSGLLIGGAVACVGLGFYAMRREWLLDRRQLMAQVQACVLADSTERFPPPQDPVARPLVIELRRHIDELRARIAELQVQKKTLEIQLRLADAEQRQTQTMINGISDAVMVTNEFDELILANPAAADLFGFDLSVALRKPATELLPIPKLAHDITDMRQNHSRLNRRAVECEVIHEGQPRTLNVTLSSVTDNTDHFCGVVTVLHDATREREIAKMKNDFVSHVSHELRTPLSSIKAYAELLVDGEAADEKTRQEFYHVIQSEADRLSRLIDNILNISRIESGMIKVTKKPLDITAILKEVLEVARPNARDKQINLVDQVSPGFFQVDADRDMIYQAVLNLISNAVKYTPAGGTVRVATQVDEDNRHVTVLVSDTGVGIPPEAMRHLFEKFYRVEAHKGMAKGSGLGLNLTRQMIEIVHKGKMIVQSEVGKGSTFGFTLPILP